MPRDMAAKCRKAMAIVAAMPLMLPAVISKPALAQVCTGPDTGGNITCPAGAYSSNINYSTNNTPLNLTLDSGVIVTSPGGNAVNLANTTGPTATSAPITITADGVTINNNHNPPSDNQTGLRIQSSGNADIAATNSTINLSGAATNWALYAIVLDGGAPHNASVNLIQGTVVTSSGIESGAIQADNRGNGNATVVASGAITVVSNAGLGTTQYGLLAHAENTAGVAGAGDASVTFNSGTLDVSAVRPRGILAWVDGNGSATVNTAVGSAINVSGTQFGGPGIYLFSSGTATAPNALTANVASKITSVGPATTNPSNLPVGIRATNSGTDAPIIVTYTGPGITTVGGNGIGILVQSGSGSITVNSSGPIATNGYGAHGVFADSPGPTGTVQVKAANVTTTGEFSTAISATGGGDVTVNVTPGGSVVGGWQADPTSVSSSLFALPAAGVNLSSTGGIATLTNDGSIGALSDLAIMGDPQVINNGTITGFVQFGGGGNSILNNGVFNLRNFADTNGDDVRDTVRVAVADLGTGPNNTFTNNGTLALAPTTGATTLVSTGQYLPLGNPNNAMAIGGPLQGQLIGVQTFTNSGVIDLQRNPAPGDVLVITGGRQAGVTGPGTYISNGGALKLDTVLNEGGAATLSDTLVVDGTSIGANGATQTFVHNANGPGALTTGDGILVVQVLDPSRSAAGAFALSGEVRGGPFDYRLFQGGLNGSNPQDWFLRSDFTVGPPEPLPPDPLPPVPPSPSPPGVDPIIGPELATYGVVQPIARQLGVTTLGTLHDRIGDTSTYGVGSCAASGVNIVRKGYESPPQAANCDTYGWFPSAWGRVFGESVNGRYSAFANPSASGQLIGFQVGLDIWRDSLAPGHSDRAGVYAAYANGNADVTGLVTNPAATGYVLQHTGAVNLNAVSGGAYWTHYGPSGWYLDAVAQGTIYSGSAATQFTSLDTTGYGFIASLEGGYPIALPPLGPGFALEPEAQVLWQTVKFDQSNDAFGNVALNSTFGWTGRLGLRAKWDVVGSNGELWQPYLRANLWQNWGANASTSFGGFPVQLLEASRQLELGGGLTTKVSANLSFYVNGDYLFAVGDTDGGKRNGVRGAAGLRYTW
jgi:outer membrane autotransporter protein